jgi:chromosome segregation ATPase
MGDDSSKSIMKSLKNEWSLFLEAFHGEENEDEKENQEAFREPMDLEEIRRMTKALVEDRKKLNQKMESLSKEIDLNSAKLESLRLVGGEDEDTLKRIHELNDLGQGITNALTKLDQRLRAIRATEDQMNEELIS